MNNGKESLLIYNDLLDFLEKELKNSVIRTAGSRDNPQNPLRMGKEITYDDTGNFVLPNSKTGISLAASLKQLDRIVRPGIKNKKWFLAVDRNSAMPEGFSLQRDNEHHWSIVVTRRMPIDEYNRKVQGIINNWRLLGRFVRYE